MDITEEQRKRAEANRLAALSKRKAAETSEHDPWKLFKCRKISPEPNPFPKPEYPMCNALPSPEKPLPVKFRVRLEICSPVAFSATPEPVPGFGYPGEAECWQKLNDCLSMVMSSHYTQNLVGGTASVYQLSDYDTVVRCLKDSKIQFERIPWVTLNVVEKLSHSVIADQWIPCMPEHLTDDKVNELIDKLPKTLLDALMPFQLDGIRFGLRRGGRCLIADEMGLGKTLQAIAIGCCFMDEGPMLVVCPAILRFSWAEELEHWLPFCLPMDIHLVFGHQDNPVYLKRCPRVVVISYTMLSRLRKSILEREWAVLIVDESHNVRCTRTSESKETKAVLDVATKVKRIILLSGTPSLSRPYDIFHQINMLWPGLLGKNKYEFAKIYCAVKHVTGSQGITSKDFSKGFRLEELSVLLKQAVMIRRLKEHVLVQLPPKRRQIIRIVLKKSDIISAISATKSIKRNTFQDEAHDEKALETFNMPNDRHHRSRRHLTFHAIGIAKVPGFLEWLSNHPIFLESETARDLDVNLSSHKMLIFAHHQKVLDGVQEFTCEKGIGFVRIDGNELPRDKQSAVRSFQSSNEVKIAIIGITVGNSGINLSAAQDVVFLELPRSPTVMEQAEDRAHRRGQTNAVNIYIFCAKDTLDETHWQYLNRSLLCVSSTVNRKHNVVQEIEVDSVSILETRGKDNDRSGENEILEHAACNELSQVECMTSQNDGIVQTLQLDQAHGEIPKNATDSSKEQNKSLFTSLTQDDRISDLEMEKHSVPEFNLVGHDFEAVQTESPGRASTYKLDVHGNNDECLKKQGLEEVSTFDTDPTCFQNNSAGLRMQLGNVSTAVLEFDGGSAELVESDACSSIQADSLRFEVSKYTERVHLYSCISGTDSRPVPLCQNFLPEELQSSNWSTADTNRNKDTNVVKDNPSYRHVLVAFIREWTNLRPIEKRKLLGKPLQLPLTLELCYLEESRNHGVKGLIKGGSKRRTTPLYDISGPLPENAFWKKICLCSGYWKKEKEYTQAWTFTDEPLCKLCQMPCKGELAKKPEYFEDLFCNLKCFEEYRVRTSQKSIRQELFRIEHGVCTICKLDCHKLVKCIRPLSLAKRREYIKKAAPNVGSRENLLDKLVHEPTEGNAWHADHIIPVYQGGGECMLENMRTLCVACHADVTVAQCAERCSMKAKAKEILQMITHNLESDSNREQLKADLEVVNAIEDELLIEVPGSAYSRDRHTDTVEGQEMSSFAQ